MPVEELTKTEKGNYILVELEDSKLLVAKHRLSYGPEVEQAAEKLRLKLENTAQEKSGRPYIGKINHEQAVKLSLTLDSTPFDLSKFKHFYNLLKKGAEGQAKVYNGNGKLVDKKELSDLFDELAGKRDPWRAEHLANSFHKVHDSLYIASDFELKEGKLRPKKLEPLEDCVMENSFIDISSLNKQGLPTQKSENSQVYFWPPRENRFAWFDADADWAVLYCCGDPLYSSSDLGVRLAKLFP